MAEAKRIGEACLFDPCFAVRSSSVEPLPHQISAVYGKMLRMHPAKSVLADDPGAGKTIMAGLLLKELMLRAGVKRALIVAPANLVEQWRDELAEKLGLRFGILANEMLAASPTGNAFLERGLLIARLDALSRDEAARQRLSAAEWDIAIIDEAHKLSASVSGSNAACALRYQLGQLLSERARHFLLLAATPHSGNTGSFLKFMSLIDEDRFQCHSENAKIKIDTSDVMRRLAKEDLLKFGGAPLFPQRIAQTAGYLLEGEELALYGDVTEYARKQFDLAERLKESQRNAVGFALTVLQRRLASSPEAIFQSPRRRRKRLCGKLDELRAQGAMPRAGGAARQQGLPYGEMPSPNIDDYDGLPEDEAGDVEAILDSATAAKTVGDLEVEIGALKGLEARADRLRKSGTGAREKIIIFAEHKDTLRYLEARIKTLLGTEAVVAIHGGMAFGDGEGQPVFRQTRFVEAGEGGSLCSAGEGINLQCAHLMINCDIPWNPNRIERRFGRIHRIGQREVCRLWNLVAEDTREGGVFKRLFDKLNVERDDLGGKVFDVLGRVAFNNRQPKDLIVEAIRSGDAPPGAPKLRALWARRSTPSASASSLGNTRFPARLWGLRR